MPDLSEAVWDTAFINRLPDAAFAGIKSGGTKDADGKTVPRALRLLPHHNQTVKSATENDSVDRPHLRNALARVSQVDAPSAMIGTMRSHLQTHARTLGIGAAAEEGVTEPEEFTLSEGFTVKTGTIAGDTIKGVAVLQAQSKHGYRYSKEALEQATKMFEGVPVYANHKDGKREIQEMIGVLREAKLDGGVVRANLTVIRPTGDWFLDAASKAPDNVGLSLEGRGRRARRGAEEVVKSVSKITRVAVVDQPATNKNLYEGTIEEEDMEKVKELEAEIVKLTEERKGLAEKITTLEAEKAEADRKAGVSKALADAKVPDEAISEEFREMLEGMDAEKAEALIKQHAVIVEKAASVKPVSKESKLFERADAETTDEQYKAAILG